MSTTKPAPKKYKLKAKEPRPEQQVFPGMKPKRIASVETAARELEDAKSAQKEAADATKEAAKECAKVMRANDLEDYGWRENGKTFRVRLEDVETVKLSVKSATS